MYLPTLNTCLQSDLDLTRHDWIYFSDELQKYYLEFFFLEIDNRGLKVVKKIKVWLWYVISPILNVKIVVSTFELLSGLEIAFLAC